MKRWVYCILVFICLLSISACACGEIVPAKINENFFIRNGIVFGMDADEIHQIEVENGNISGASLVSSEDGWKYYYPDCDAGYQTSLAGYECDIVYYFDDEDLLSGFKYILESERGFKSIKDSLTKKYGKAGTIYDKPPFETQTLSVAAWMVESEIVNAELTTYDWWLVQYQDCYVFIEATTSKFYHYNTYYRIDYSVFSNEEAAVVLGIKEFADQQAEQSLENDL